MLKPYFKYLLYILDHKKNVFMECMNMAKQFKGKYKRELIIHAFTHDLSKFRPTEFIPYARYFYGDFPTLYDPKFGQYTGKFKEDIKIDFEKAWELHYKRNKHHPEHWKGHYMSTKYIRQMVCDLKAMSRKFGGTAQEYYLKNYYKWNIHRDTRYYLEIYLDLLNYNAPICECDNEYWMTIEELIQDSENYFKEHQKEYGTTILENIKTNINNLLKPACDKYNVDVYELIKQSANKIKKGE